MRGAAYDRFGDESVLQIRDDLPEPPVGPDVVLVRAHAAGVNPVDLSIREGYLVGAYPHHFPITPGWDLSGVVEKVGPAVVDFAVGDADRPSLEELLLGPTADPSGERNLFGAVRRVMGKCGYSTLKEFQKAELIVTGPR